MKLLGELDQAVKANSKFKAAYYRKVDLLGIWEIIEFEATAQGATSIYVDSTRLFKLEQGNSFSRYVNLFRELVERLEKKACSKEKATSGTAMEYKICSRIKPGGV